jgi:hypothetical protein
MRALLMFLLILSFSALAPVPAQSSDLDSLVQSIASATTQDLSSLSFFELNILKNAIFSSKGFKYAKDRIWLFSYFYGKKSKMEKHLPARWDLGKYDFPKPIKGDQFATDSVMEKAIANVRVALYKKIRGFQNVQNADSALDREYQAHCTIKEFANGLEIFGRKIGGGLQFKESIKREIHGYRCILSIIDENRGFDACELLGVYVGSVAMLKSVIQAQNGKSFDGTLGWEISQLAGVTPKSEKYDESKLPDSVKSKIKLLDAVMQKIANSEIGDVPEQFRNRGNLADINYIEGC